MDVDLVRMDIALAGERLTDSATEGYTVVRQECNVAIISGTSLVGLGGGAANDSHLIGILLLKNAGPAAVTVKGFADQSGAAADIVLTGSTTGDTIYDFGGMINSAGGLSVTPTVTNTVVARWKRRA